MGASTQTSTSQQHSETQPWAPAIPGLQQAIGDAKTLYDSGAGTAIYGGPRVAQLGSDAPGGLQSIRDQTASDNAGALGTSYLQNVLGSGGISATTRQGLDMLSAVPNVDTSRLSSLADYIGSGSGGGAAGWSRGIQGMLAAGQNAGKADLERAKAQAELSKQQCELAGQNQTAKIIAQRMGMPLEDATALAMNPQFVQGFLSSQFGAQDGRTRNADGTMSVIPGSQQDPTQVAAAAAAGREPIADAAARAGAIKTAEQAAGLDDIETKEVPGFGLVSINKTKLGSEKADERAGALSVLVPGQKPRPMTAEESKAFQGGYFDANGVPHTQAGGVTVNMPPAEKAEQAKIGDARQCGCRPDHG